MQNMTLNRIENFNQKVLEKRFKLIKHSEEDFILSLNHFSNIFTH
jgi:hypothetical protein